MTRDDPRLGAALDSLGAALLSWREGDQATQPRWLPAFS